LRQALRIILGTQVLTDLRIPAMKVNIKTESILSEDFHCNGVERLTRFEAIRKDVDNNGSQCMYRFFGEMLVIPK
jgi:hypothetical protein